MADEPQTNTELAYLFIGKAKLPRGLSFPIKRSALDEFLRRESIAGVTGVGFSGGSPFGVVLSASYYGPRHRHMRHTLNLWVNAIPSDVRSQVESLILSVVFPPLAEWLRSFSDASLLRARTDHTICFSLERLSSPSGGGELRLLQHRGPWPYADA